MADVWVLTDDILGHTNQSLGVAESLELSTVVKKIVHTKRAAWPNILRFGFCGVDLEKSDELSAPYPDVVIATGRKLAPVARAIKKQSRGKTLAVQLMWPGFPAWGFDLIAVPEHDGLTPAKNRMITLGAPHRITPEILEREGAMWEKSLKHFAKPYVALLVGGDTKEGVFTEEMAEFLGREATRIAKEHKATLMISASRRTSEKAKKSLLSAIKAPHHFHDPLTTTKLNPYIAYLALSDLIIATGDSISMCSEAASVGKPLFIYAPAGLASEKHAKFHSSLFARGLAHPLVADVSTKNVSVSTSAPLAAQEIASAIVRMVEKKLSA